MCAEHVRQLTPDLPVIVVVGATATGKTVLALRLAARFNAEIINSDSRYLYRGMDVGTAKPSAVERGRIPHHLLDVLDPSETYSLATFLDAAFSAIEAVAARRRLPLVVGGTPQYARALLEGWQTPAVPPNDTLRADLEAVAVGELIERLRTVDPASAERIGPNQRRLIRALEIHAATGQPASELRGKQKPPYRFLTIGLRQPREKLYARIDERTRWMFANGLLDEARALMGLDPNVPALSSIGYPEARDAMVGRLELEAAIERTQFATHRYVRHQETWFRRFPDVRWFDSSVAGYEADVERAVTAFLA